MNRYANFTNNNRVSTFDATFDKSKITYVTVRYNNEKLDYLASNYYNDGTLWWIIAMFNNIKYPFNIDKDYLDIPVDKDQFLQNI